MNLSLWIDADKTHNFREDLIKHSPHKWCIDETLLDVLYFQASDLVMVHVTDLLLWTTYFQFDGMPNWMKKSLIISVISSPTLLVLKYNGYVYKIQDSIVSMLSWLYIKFHHSEEQIL